MEDIDTSSLIYRACELARKLESNFPTLTNKPDMLSMAIDEIVKAFFAAKERLLFSHHQTPPSSSFAQTQQLQMGSTSLMQEWLIRSSNYAQPVDHLIQTQELQAAPTEASPSRLRRRKDDSEKMTVMAPAPQFGNTEVPPEDGFTWRKYGQKEIFGTKYPRSYYRCTHQKLCECGAKKQVQRLDHNPNIFAITYRGSHSCIMSSIAPSSIPPPKVLLDISQQDMTISSQLSSSSTPVSPWLTSGYRSLHGGAATAPAGVDAGSAIAGPSTSRYGSNTDYLADMADAMFNSGSSSGNSTMESLFPFTEDK